MKKIFSILAAVLFAGSMMADSYVKVTEEPTDWAGDYLIVYEAGGVAFDGGLTTLDAASNTVAVTISEGAIAATDALNAAKFTIAEVTGGYSLQSASGKFIGVTSNSNGLKQADAVGNYTHDLSLDESGNAVIKANFAESTMTLRYNKASGQTRFRYYKSGQEPVALYKFVAGGEGGEGGDTPVIVKTLKSIALSGMKTEFETIDKFKFDGKVTATYSVVKDEEPQEDEEKEVKPTSVSEPDMTQVGEQDVTVSYTEGEVTREATYTITITEHVITPGTQDVALNNEFFGTTLNSNITEAVSARYKDVTATVSFNDEASTKPRTDATYVRFYKGGELTLAVPEGYEISSIKFTTESDYSQPTASTGSFDAEDAKAWTGKAKEVKFTFAAKAFINKAEVTFAVAGETPDPTPEVVANYCQTQVTHFNLPAETASAVLLSIGVKGEKTIVRIDKVSEEAKNLDFLQVTPDNTGSQLEEGGSEALAIEITTPAATNDSLTFQILWSVVGNGGNWMVENLRVAVADCEYAVIPAAPLPDPTNCAEAAEAALSVSADNELYNDGKEYTIEGYVTAIETAYSSKFNNISFWIADEAEGGKVIEAFRAACAAAEDAPNVGDKVSVTGKLTKYGTTPEFAAGCTFEILERAEVVEPENLGEKTIAEFLELKNEKDTCILTGTVIEIVNDQFGNLTIQDATGSLYIYGVLNAAGESKKFGELDVEVNDVLTVKAIYNEYQGNPQAKNAIFVSREKAQATAIDNAGAEMKAQKIVRDGQIIIVRGGVEYNVTGQNVR